MLPPDVGFESAGGRRNSVALWAGPLRPFRADGAAVDGKGRQIRQARQARQAAYGRFGRHAREGRAGYGRARQGTARYDRVGHGTARYGRVWQGTGSVHAGYREGMTAQQVRQVWQVRKTGETSPSECGRGRRLRMVTTRYDRALQVRPVTAGAGREMYFAYCVLL